MDNKSSSDSSTDKYKLTKHKKVINTKKGKITLYRIEALDDIPRHFVKKGDLGGWVGAERNLAQSGDCWIDKSACVFEYAYVKDDALVTDSAKVYGEATICGDAKITCNAQVYGDAIVCDSSRVEGQARVSSYACIFGHSEIMGNSHVMGRASVHSSIVCDDARVCKHARLRECVVQDSAKICSYNTQVRGCTIVGDAVIKSQHDFLVFKNTWSSGRVIVYTRSNDKWHAGCFYGSGAELIERAYNDSVLSGRCYEATVKTAEKIMKLLQLFE